MEISGKRILVVGGAGFIGSHVVEELLKEPVQEVLVYDNLTRGNLENLETSLADPRCRMFELRGDVLQRDVLDKAMEGCDAVVHLAALWLLHCQEYPESAFEVNIRGTFNVLQASVRHRIQRLIFSSSASVYGDALEEPMKESHPYNNWTFYGATKIAGEQMFKAFHRRFGLEGVGLRYMNVYGPRQDYEGAYTAVMMKMLDAIDRGEPLSVYGDGSQSYDFVHVRDVARSNVCALKASVPFGFYNVGRGVKTSIRELAELLLALRGSSLPIRCVAGGQTFVTNRVGCPEAAGRDIGFRWTLGLEDGMRSLVEWRQARKNAKDAPAAKFQK
ncbi:MAG: SDR family NAD(P)-dependent oxidoreductase [Planctomycetes bacterium]|nr:SDR family NAD(P)-dependent oxidoreductase [Planctomycetota bacterium]